MFDTSTCSTIACILRIVDNGYITSPAASLPGSLADWLPDPPKKVLGGTRSGALKYGCGSSEPVASNLPCFARLNASSNLSASSMLPNFSASVSTAGSSSA